jgi:hypothetical protein
MPPDVKQWGGVRLKINRTIHPTNKKSDTSFWRVSCDVSFLLDKALKMCYNYAENDFGGN